MRVLVTGGAGFIGSHLVEELVAHGADIVVLDNLSTGSLGNLKGVFSQIGFIDGDIRDLRVVREATEGADYVFHQAALPSVARSVEDPVATNEVNVRGTLNVLVAARKCGVKRVIYASSSAVYGDTPELPKTEGMRVNPMSPYAVSKLAGEYYCRAFTHVYGLSTVCLRYFNVFGARQNPDSPYAAVVPLFVRAIQRSEPCTVFGDGEQTRDFTHILNVVHANTQAMEVPGASGEVFNIACGRQTSLSQVLEILARVSGRTPVMRYEAERPGDVRHSLASIERAMEILGYRPSVELEEGLAALWREAVDASST